MTDQQFQNLAFELLSTNQTLQVIATVLYEMQQPQAQTVHELIGDELRSIQMRIERLHALSRPKTK